MAYVLLRQIAVPIPAPSETTLLRVLGVTGTRLIVAAISAIIGVIAVVNLLPIIALFDEP